MYPAGFEPGLFRIVHGRLKLLDRSDWWWAVFKSLIHLYKHVIKIISTRGNFKLIMVKCTNVYELFFFMNIWQNLHLFCQFRYHLLLFKQSFARTRRNGNQFCCCNLFNWYCDVYYTSLLNTAYRHLRWSSGLRHPSMVRKVAGSNPVGYIYFHFDFSLASRSSQLGKAHPIQARYPSEVEVAQR